MSIILDALRKAEASRRGEGSFGLTHAPAPRVPLHARIPVGFVAAGAALFLSVGVGAWLLWPDEAADTSVARVDPAPGAKPAQPPAGTGAAATTPPSETAPRATTATASPATAATAPAATDATPPAPPPVAPLAGAEPSPSGATSTAPVTPKPAAPPAGASPAPGAPMADAPADVRLLALEARLADPRAAAPPAQARPRGGSVEVRDLLGPGTDAGAGGQPRKPGSVEVRDLLAEQGAQPVEQEGEAPAVVSDADGEVRAPSAARPAAAPRGSAPPPGAALPPHATPPAPQPQRDVPSLDDLVASGQLNPPDISLDMHAYGPVAEARFVYINMRRYHIGDTTREGAVVEDITPDGVVLLLQGRRFELSAR